MACVTAGVLFTKHRMSYITVRIFLTKHLMAYMPTHVSFTKGTMQYRTARVLKTKTGVFLRATEIISRNVQSHHSQKSVFRIRDFWQAAPCSGLRFGLLWLCIFLADPQTKNR